MADQKLIDDAAADATRLLVQSYGSFERIERLGRVDPIAIAQSLGVEVFTAKLPDDVAGILVKRYGQDAQIHLNAGDSSNRQRFTAAHELGHYIRNTADAGEADIDRVDFRDNIAAQGTDVDEIYANTFAAQLLMPHQLVRPAWRRGDRAPELAARFEVSVGAMTNRVKNLSLR